MNERITGWKLGLLLLIPLVIIGVAVWLGLQALGGDDTETVSATDDQVAQVQAVPPTQVPVTEPLSEPTAVPPPTAIPLPPAAPTAVPAPTAAPEPTEAPAPTAEPAATSAPAATAEPAATTAPAATAAPVATTDPAATPDPNATVDPDATPLPEGAVLINCSVPATLGVDETFGPIEATTTPPESAELLRFVWNFGNAYTVGAQRTGEISYDAAGTYPVTVAATDTVTGQVFTGSCGTVTVGGALSGGDDDEAIEVKCSVRPADSEEKFEDARIGDNMVGTITWTPNDLKLNLQWSFDPLDEFVLLSDQASGASQSRFLAFEDSQFKVLWTYPETNEQGSVACNAYPPQN